MFRKTAVENQRSGIGILIISIIYSSVYISGYKSWLFLFGFSVQVKAHSFSNTPRPLPLDVKFVQQADNDDNAEVDDG